MNRLLQLLAVIFVWSAVLTPLGNFHNPIPFGSLSLFALIAVANVYQSSERRQKAVVTWPLLSTLLMAIVFCSVVLIGDMRNSFSIIGVDMTIASTSLTAAIFWILRASMPPQRTASV